jgi:hypothetical protein
MPRRTAATPAVPDPSHAEGPDPDQAWRTLELVRSLAVHADGKAAATLTGAGVGGGVLFSLAHGVRAPQTAAIVIALLSGLGFFAAGIFSGISLWARSAPPGTPSSLIYFDHVTRMHRRSPQMYAAELRELTTDRNALIDQIAAQIWANSLVARRKFQLTNYGLGSLLAALLFLAVAGLLFLITR